MKCDKCGTPIKIGDFPFCPHGRSRAGVITDEIPGGVTIENLGPNPVKVYTHTERLNLAKRQGLREPTKADLPDSKAVVSWATMDAYTLEAAKSLVSRANALIEQADAEIAENNKNRVHYRRIEQVATLPVNPMEGL